jgi:hypothetical protein
MSVVLKIVLATILSLFIPLAYAVDSTVIKPITKSTITGYPTYQYTINFNTDGWSCNNCNEEKSSQLIPAPSLPSGNAPSTLPAGTYSVNASVTITNQNGIGRWININNLRIFESQTTPYTLAQTGNLGTQSCDGSNCNTWSQTYTMSAIVFVNASFTPYFGITVGDSSHNETSYGFNGTVTFSPVS